MPLFAVMTPSCSPQPLYIIMSFFIAHTSNFERRLLLPSALVLTISRTPWCASTSGEPVPSCTISIFPGSMVLIVRYYQHRGCIFLIPSARTFSDFWRCQSLRRRPTPGNLPGQGGRSLDITSRTVVSLSARQILRRLMLVRPLLHSAYRCTRMICEHCHPLSRLSFTKSFVSICLPGPTVPVLYRGRWFPL